MAEKAADNYPASFLELNPKSAPAELGWGPPALALEGKLDEAEPHFRQAIQRDPKFRRLALLSLAALYEENKQTAQAIAIYREFPDNPGVQEHTGKLLLQSQKYSGRDSATGTGLPEGAEPAQSEGAGGRLFGRSAAR